MLLKGSKTEINLKKAFEEKAQFSRREIKTSNVEMLSAVIVVLALYFLLLFNLFWATKIL